jgi:LysM repeat protein
LKIKSRLFIKLLTLAVILGIYTLPAQASSLNVPTAYDLIATVNSLRASNGLPPLRTNSSLMLAAQSHSDYQASIGTWSHVGANGSSPTQRVKAAGYGTSIFTSENVAQLSSGITIDTLINTVWADSLHMATMLSTKATDMGAGVTEKDGYVYYTLDVSYVDGHPAKNVKPSPTQGVFVTPIKAAASATLDSSDSSSSNNSQFVQTVTPQNVGIVVHEVQAGESLYSIAVAYGTTITDIRTRNGIAENNDVIYVDQKLLIRVILTPTASPFPTETEPSPTDTPVPTNTMVLPTLTVTPSAALTFTPESTLIFTPLPLQSPAPLNESNQPPSIGLILVVIGGLALVGALAYYFLRKNKT